MRNVGDTGTADRGAGGSDDSVARNIVDLECAGIFVAQDEIGRTGCTALHPLYPMTTVSYF